MKLFTIGHSAHSIEKLVALLKSQKIQTLVDVRSIPSSRYHPQFRKRNLEQALKAENIGYRFLGQQLGGRPTDPSCYPDGLSPDKRQKPWPRPDYNAMMEREWFAQGMEQLLIIAGQGDTAILCSEEDPARCHRHQLIAQHLKREHPEVEVWHIRGNGTLVSAADIFAANSGQQLVVIENTKTEDRKK
jgi:uncharacterized protein (DUF488 family)